MKNPNSYLPPFLKLTLGAGLLIALVPGCEGSDQDPSPEPGAGPLYAMMIQVYDPEDRTVYVSLSDTLDIGTPDLKQSREFPSVANMESARGRILVSDGLKPEIHEFEISDDLEWIPGRTLSFADYPLPDNANFYYQFLIDDTHALLPFDVTKRIHWNPAEMVIEGTVEDSTLESIEKNLSLEAGGNRNSVRYDASIVQAFFYHDDDWFDYGTTSHLVVYDKKTFEEKRITDVPCPGLSLATRDEEGSTYFATWDLPTNNLTEENGTSCIAKVTADGVLDEIIDLREWTDGRAVNNFRYVGNDKGVANVLHHEELGVSSPSELSSEMVDELWQSGPHWKLWLFDVVKGTGKPIQGIDNDLGSGAQFAVLDGRTFVFLPYDEWSRTKGYEIAEDGTATEHFDTVGDVFKWIRVR